MKAAASDRLNGTIIRTKAIAAMMSNYFCSDNEKLITLGDETISALAWQVEENLDHMDTLIAEIMADKVITN